LVLNLEGRPPTPAAAYSLVVDIGRQVKSGAWGQVAVVLASSDLGLRAVAQALAETHDVPLFWSSSVNAIADAEPLGKLTPADRETLAALRRLGGRATVGLLAEDMGADHTAAGNRVSNLDKRHLIFRIDRPRPSGHLYMDPRIADWGGFSPAAGLDSGKMSQQLQTDMGVLASMQVSATAEELASAWREFLMRHHDELVRGHEQARNLVTRGDQAGIAAIARGYARSKARNRVRRTKA
jgi:hypothetical protein